MSRRTLLDNRGPAIDVVDVPETSMAKLKLENDNLKRLLRLIKVHVIYDEQLYKEIKDAIKE